MMLDIFMSTLKELSWFRVSKSETVESASEPVYVPDAKQSDSIAQTWHEMSRSVERYIKSYDIIAGFNI